MALPCEHRLSNGKMISLVCKKGASIRTPFFRIIFLPAYKGAAKSVVVVSKKKYDKRAVVRNLARRRINGVLQSQMKNFFREKKFLLVIFPNEALKKCDIKNLENSLYSSFQKISCWDFSRKRNFSSQRKK